MPKCLFFTCPTDCLEHTINATFTYENYFYNSLGNSFIYDGKTIENIWQIVKKHAIEEIYFVLSIDNRIVLDALGDAKFSTIGTLSNFYRDIKRQSKCSNTLYQGDTSKFSILSYFLNKKIKEFENTNVSKLPIKVGGKIYDRNQNTFGIIYSNLVCLEEYHLN